MTQLSDFQIGQTVELTDGQTASVQFVGHTSFAPGDWVGIVFDEAIGKNDGSVQGQRYFECPTGHGMFIRPTVATILDQPTPRPAVRMNGKANGTATKGKPVSTTKAGLKRQSIADPAGAKRQSINASSPTPTARVSRLAVSHFLSFMRMFCADEALTEFQQVSYETAWLCPLVGIFYTFSNRNSFIPQVYGCSGT